MFTVTETPEEIRRTSNPKNLMISRKSFEALEAVAKEGREMLGVSPNKLWVVEMVPWISIVHDLAKLETFLAKVRHSMERPSRLP